MNGSRHVDVRLTLSKTPLAREHDRALRGERGRVPRPIPWERFDRRAYPRAALRLAGDLCSRLGSGEYSSIALFSQIASGLALTEAPFDLILAATRISSDELRHAEYCLKMAELCAGSEVALQIEKDAIEASLSAPLDGETVDHLILKYGAVGETLAAALLTECRRRARDPVAKALFTSLAGDEVIHARFGWHYAAHRAERWSVAERQRQADRLAEFVMDLEQNFWMGRDAPPEAEDAARSLGVLDSKTQRDVISDVMESEIVPALDAIGFSGSLMWAGRRRVQL